MTPADVLACRQRMKLTQLGMAQMLGVNERTYQRWEYGECPVPEIAARFMATLESRE